MCAIFIPSALLDEIRNSIGNVTFSRGHFGDFIRKRVTPTNPDSSLQQTVRDNFTTLATTWRTLTDSQREAWGTYGAGIQKTNPLGQNFTLLGLNAYIAANTLRLLGPLARRDDGPTAQGLGPALNTDWSASNVDVSDDAFNITDMATFAPGFNSDDPAQVLLFFIGQPITSSINFFSGPFKLLGHVQGDAGVPPTSASLTNPFAPTAGDEQIVRAYHLTGTGQMVPSVQNRYTVQA